MELLLVIGLLIALATAAVCWGCDSRDGFTEAHPARRRSGLF